MTTPPFGHPLEATPPSPPRSAEAKHALPPALAPSSILKEGEFKSPLEGEARNSP